jgi:hypothetical protein
MPEIGTSGSMSGDGKRGVAEWPKLPRPSSTLPKRHFAAARQFGRFRTDADIGLDFISTRPSVMGPMRSSPPCDRHAAELTLLSVVDAKAATLCLLEGAVSLSRYACSSCDDHWPCNGFTASTVPATGLRAVGLRSAYSHLVFLLVIPAPRSGAR